MTDGFDELLDPAQVGEVLDFASPGIEPKIADEQRLGTTAIYSILCREGVAYLADEVGMGKTYQALGVVALTWLVDPSARVLVITPRKAVQQKWHRDYRNFVSTNVEIADRRLKDPFLQQAVHPRCFCDNLIELGQELCRDPRRLFMTRLSSYSWVARSLGVLDSGETSTGREIAEALRGKGLFVEPDAEHLDETFEGSTEQNVEVARQMAQLLPEFDLVVVDEAQKLRNKGSNIRTQVLNTLLGFYPWTDPSEVEPNTESPPRLLLLSATPAHRSEDDIYRQLSYASVEALPAAERPSAERQEYLDRVMVRRLRKLAGHSKYDYRREKPVVWDRDQTSPDRIVDELFLANVQRELQSALDRDSVGAQLEIGFLETFESYEPSDLDEATADDEKMEGEATGSTHYEAEDDSVAPDHRVLNEIAEKFAEQTGDCLPPHPKQRLVDEVARDSFEADRPQKLLIFVRRLASVRELTRRICEIYDEVTLERLSEQIGPERIRERVEPHFDFDRFETPEQFRTYADIVLGTELEDANLAAADEDRDDDSVAQSEVLAVMGSSPDETTPGEKLLRRLVADKSLASIFEENFIRFLFRQLESASFRDGAYREFCREVCNARVRSTFNRILAEDRAAAERGEDSHYFRTNLSANFSRIRALLYELAIQRADELYPDEPIVSELLRIHREIHGAKHQLDDDAEPERGFPEYIDEFLEHRSFWDLAFERDEDLRLTGLLRGEEPYGGEPGSWLEYREFIKRIVEKNIRVSDAVLHLFVAYDRAGGANPERVAHELAEIVFSSEGVRTRHRIEDLIEQGPALEKLAGGRLSSDESLYAETRWKDFDRQQPALGAMGSTSSRYPVIVKFNAPFFPDFVVATDVFREGVDLHMSCRRVWHFGMVANPGDVEQRSGRIDRYFSKVHRTLQEENDTTTDDPEGQVHIGYPYLARTIDEQQVTRVLKRKLEVQPVMDKGLSVSEDIRLDLDRRSDETARELLDELSQLTSDEATPFPVERHLENGRYAEALKPKRHASAAKLADWLTQKCRELEQDVPLTQPIADEFAKSDNARLRALPALTDIAVSRIDDTSEVVDPRQADGEFREQPIQIDVGFVAALRTHYLRFASPLGDHQEPIPTELQRALHADYADAPLRLHFDPEKSSQRRQWRLMISTDVALPVQPEEWPSTDRLHGRIVELAEAADDLEWRLLELAELRQDLTYEEVQ